MQNGDLITMKKKTYSNLENTVNKAIRKNHSWVAIAIKNYKNKTTEVTLYPIMKANELINSIKEQYTFYLELKDSRDYIRIIDFGSNKTVASVERRFGKYRKTIQ